jgi:hypothetical protein
MTKETELLRRAEQEAQSAGTWADLSNALFDPIRGLIAKAFPTREAREAFLRTEEFRQIRALIARAREQTGLVAGASPQKSGRLVVRLPRSLHAALEQEASEEGVSLNQLVVVKLAARLSDLAGLPAQQSTEQVG